MPTGTPEPSPRGEGVFWQVFGTRTMPTGTSVPSPRGEASFNRSRTGLFPMILPTLRHGDHAHRYLSAIPAWRRGSSDRSSARLPCPQVPQWHLGVAKGRKSVPLTGLRSGLRPGLARRPYQQVPQWHPRVAKRDFWPVFGPSGGQHIRRTRGYAASGPQVCIFSAREYVSPVRPPAYSVGPGIFSECPAFQSRS